MFISRKMTVYFFRVVLSLLVVGGVFFAYRHVVMQIAVNAFYQQASVRSRALDDLLLKHRILGTTRSLGSTHTGIQRIAAGVIAVDDPDVLAVLASIKRQYAASIAYVMNLSGDVVACTPYDDHKTLTGHNYAFRSYFSKASKGEDVVYAALGATTFQRGLYYASPVMEHAAAEKIVGVLVIKIGLEEVDAYIRDDRYLTAVVSPDNIVFASTVSKWLFKPLFSVTDQQRSALSSSRQFGDLMNTANVLDKMDKNAGAVLMDGRRFYVAKSSLELSDEKGNWQFQLFIEENDLLPAGLFWSGFALLVAFLLLIWWGVVSYIRNKRDTDAMLMSAVNYNRLVEQTQTIVWEVNAQGLFTQVNPSVHKVLGLSREELVNKKYIYDLHPEKGSGTFKRDLFEIFLNKELIKEQETCLQTKNGAEVWVLRNGAPILNSRGVLLGYRGEDRDITARRTAEMLLQHKYRDMEHLLENVQFGVVMISRKGRQIVWANSAAVKMAGVASFSEMKGQSCRKYLCASDQDKCPHLDLGEKIESSERILRRHDGTEIPILKTVTQIMFNDQDVLLETFIDLSRQKEMDAQLRQSFQQISKNHQIALSMMEDANNARKEAEALKREADAAYLAKSQFLANMSHEIRTPMNAILGFSKLLKTTELNDKQTGFLEMVLSSGDLLLRVINDILDYSKLEAKKIDLELIDFDVYALIQDVFQMAVMDMPNAGQIHTYINIESNVPRMVKGDPTRLRQILLNLLANAVKFTAEGDIGLNLSVEQVEDTPGELLILRFCVQDTGIGIGQDKIGMIFNAFTQADTTTTRKYGGTGLGLSICKELVSIMGGRIWVESEVNKGSRFIFTLTLAESEPSCYEKLDRVSLAGIQGKKVVILDDSHISRKLLERYCREQRMEILAIEEDPQVILKKLGEWKDQGMLPDLFLCDIHLPCIDGYEISRILRNDPGFGSMKFIAVSSDVHVGEAVESREKKIDGYITKPFIPTELYRVMAGVFPQEVSLETSGVDKPVDEASLCRGVRVLVVEDNIANRMLMEGYLLMLEAQVDFAVNGEEAVAKIRGNTYDLCFMDIQMPVMSGLDATRIIRAEISKDFPVIALSAAVMKEDRDKGYEAGMTDYINKPVDIDSLKKIIIKWK